MTRTAISPRFATRTRLNTVEREGGDRFELEQQLPELDGLRVLHVDRPDDPLVVGFDLVHELHRLEDAQGLAGADGVADLDERRRARLRRAVERADHRNRDAPHRVPGGRDGY